MTCLEALIEAVSESSSLTLHEKHKLVDWLEYNIDAGSLPTDTPLECPVEKQHPIIDGGFCCDECGFNMED